MEPRQGGIAAAVEALNLMNRYALKILVAIIAALVLATPATFAQQVAAPSLPATDQTATDQTAADQTAADQTGAGDVTDTAEAASDAAADADDFVPAIRLLPETVAGLMRIPNLPKFCDASKQTLLGQMLADPVMQPFVDSQRERAKDYLGSINDKVGLNAEDLYEVASGEVVFAWLPFETDSRRPYALAVVADVRNRDVEVDKALEQIDSDLKESGWDRADKQHNDQSYRVYTRKPKPGQLKIEQICLFQSADRLIAADRDTVVTDLLDAIAGQNAAAKIADQADFKTVLQRSARELIPPTRAGGGTIAMEWFVRPFAMGRIVRKSLSVDRGNDVDILRLLENQGFDAIRAAGGIVVINGKTYDILHKGFVLAPPTAEGDQRYAKAAAMLNFPNVPIEALPAWVPDSIAAISRISVKIENAFWSSEPLVNEAVGDDIFRDMIDGIKEDRDGPRIDLAGNVLPNLDDFVLVLRDNQLPITLQSERLLVAIRVRDGDKIRAAVAKMMDAEQDAELVDGPAGVNIYRVQRSDDDLEDLEADLFGDFDDDPVDDGPAPLLEKWAIALVPASANNPQPYLMVSSDDRFLAEMANRAAAGAGASFADLPEIQKLKSSLAELGGDDMAVNRLTRTRLSLRAKYELLRQGKLKDSDSIGSSLIRRFVNEEDLQEVDAETVDAKKLPPIEAIERYLPNGAASITTTEDGWQMSGFFFKEVD